MAISKSARIKAKTNSIKKPEASKKPVKKNSTLTGGHQMGIRFTGTEYDQLDQLTDLVAATREDSGDASKVTRSLIMRLGLAILSEPSNQKRLIKSVSNKLDA
ncbi:MAG: hypothetical protein HRU20_28100 [Pseudomonadales bacterium]|nr:hypothetical protein [Pseudomonadales bacterium]